MSTTQMPKPAAPVITHAATKPPVPRKLFVNIPVADLQRSIRFFEALGFTFNPQFTDPSGTCMLVGEDAYCMLLERKRFGGFAHGRAVGDPSREVTALFTFAVESREAVDDMVRRAVKAGGSPAGEPEDHGFMYDWSFFDPDGHGWGVFWMDPNAVQG